MGQLICRSTARPRAPTPPALRLPQQRALHRLLRPRPLLQLLRQQLPNGWSHTPRLASSAPIHATTTALPLLRARLVQSRPSLHRCASPSMTTTGSLPCATSSTLLCATA